MRWKTGDKTYGINKPAQHFVSHPPLPSFPSFSARHLPRWTNFLATILIHNNSHWAPQYELDKLTITNNDLAEKGFFFFLTTYHVASQKRSYHPGEMAPLRTPYDFDDEGNATSTSTTEPSSSGFRSSITSRYTTEDGTSTIGDDTSVPGMCTDHLFSLAVTHFFFRIYKIVSFSKIFERKGSQRKVLLSSVLINGFTLGFILEWNAGQ